jgi:hypothetical protein
VVRPVRWLKSVSTVMMIWSAVAENTDLKHARLYNVPNNDVCLIHSYDVVPVVQDIVPNTVQDSKRS